MYTGTRIFPKMLFTILVLVQKCFFFLMIMQKSSSVNVSTPTKKSTSKTNLVLMRDLDGVGQKASTVWSLSLLKHIIIVDAQKGFTYAILATILVTFLLRLFLVF